MVHLDAENLLNPSDFVFWVSLPPHLSLSLCASFEFIKIKRTLKQNVIILLARLFPLKSVCIESASSTSLENMFQSSW